MALQFDGAIVAVFVLSALAVSVGSLYAPVPGVAVLWVAALVPWVGILVWRDPAPLWLAALSAGLLAGLATGVVQAAFQGVYFAHHPADAASYAGRSTTALAAQFVGFALVAGTAWGGLAGLVAWAFRRFGAA